MTLVTLDAWALDGAAAYRGVGTYIRHIVAGLGSVDAGLEVRAMAVPSSPLPAGIERFDLRRHAPPRLALNEHEWRLPREIRRAGGDVFFEPAPDPPRRCALPHVQTLHDVIPLVLDDPALARERRRWARYADRYRAADAVIAVSRHAADEGMRLLGLDAARVHVCYHGVDPAFAPDTGAVHGNDGRPYVLVVGEYSPRKGYGAAFSVLEALDLSGLPHELLVAGRIVPWTARSVAAAKADARHADRVRLLGFVDDLPALYRGASAYLATSQAEGFGLPVLEAMACGTPVVAFAHPATVEVLGDAGALVAEGDLGALGEAVVRVLSSPAWAAELRQAGLRRAANFTWPTATTIHADVLRSVADRGR